MTQHEDQTASAVSIDPLLFQEKFDQLNADLAPLFTRREPRAHAAAYVRGLLADLPRKNCWTLSEHTGQARASGMQRLLYQAVWDEEAARDVVRSFAMLHLAAPGAVLVFDETGQEKKGIATAGVGRQYTGTTGQVSNAVVTVYCTYASPLGHCLIDGDLYVQEHWTKDPDRCEQAGLGRDFTFRTKTAIALEQARRAVAAGVAVDWAAGDEVYGRSSQLRSFFEEQAIGYVFAVGVNFHVPTGVGPVRADLLAARKIPKRAWNRLSCGQGAKGPRVYDWALIATNSPRHHLLVRRSLADPTDLAFFYTYVPPGRSMALADLVKIAGIRWAVEEDFANGKDVVGLDHTQARRYRSWRRHAVLAMAALALLAVIASLDRRHHPAPVLPTDGAAEPWADLPRRAAGPVVGYVAGRDFRDKEVRSRCTTCVRPGPAVRADRSWPPLPAGGLRRSTSARGVAPRPNFPCPRKAATCARCAAGWLASRGSRRSCGRGETRSAPGRGGCSRVVSWPSCGSS